MSKAMTSSNTGVGFLLGDLNYIHIGKYFRDGPIP